MDLWETKNLEQTTRFENFPRFPRFPRQFYTLIYFQIFGQKFSFLVTQKIWRGRRGNLLKTLIRLSLKPLRRLLRLPREALHALQILVSALAKCHQKSGGGKLKLSKNSYPVRYSLSFQRQFLQHGLFLPNLRQSFFPS